MQPDYPAVQVCPDCATDYHTANQRTVHDYGSSSDVKLIAFSGHYENTTLLRQFPV